MLALQTRRAEPGHVNDLLAAARACEIAVTLARSRDVVVLPGITEQDVCGTQGYDRPVRVPARCYDLSTGNK